MFGLAAPPAEGSKTPTLFGGVCRAAAATHAGGLLSNGNRGFPTTTPQSVLNAGVLATPEGEPHSPPDSPSHSGHVPLPISLHGSPTGSPQRLKKTLPSRLETSLSLNLTFKGFDSPDHDEGVVTPKLEGSPSWPAAISSQSPQSVPAPRSRLKGSARPLSNSQPSPICVASSVRSGHRRRFRDPFSSLDLSSSLCKVSLNSTVLFPGHDDDDLVMSVSDQSDSEGGSVTPEKASQGPSAESPFWSVRSPPEGAPFALHKRSLFGFGGRRARPEAAEGSPSQEQHSSEPPAAPQEGKRQGGSPVVATHLASPQKTDSPVIELPLSRQSSMLSVLLPPAGSGQLRFSSEPGLRRKDSQGSQEGPGMMCRMLNRAPSYNPPATPAIDINMSGDDRASDSSSVPHTPNSSVPHTPSSPDPSWIMNTTVWGGECPPTPTHQRINPVMLQRQPSADGVEEGPDELPRRRVARTHSLCDDKVLIQTSQLRRSDSVNDPKAFKFQDHFEFIRTIGYSKHSEVSAVRHRTRNEKYAIKKTRRQFRSRSDRERCLHEILAVASLPPHPNIVGQYRAWQQAGHFYIQMDLCAGGSLAAILQGARIADDMLEDGLLWQVLLDISSGLDFLHCNGVTHLDIKPENIYKDSKGSFRVGDFGLAVLRDEWAAEEGDGEYVAPEALQHNSAPKAPADVFSLGVTMYECATLEKLPRSGSGRHAENVFLPTRPQEFQAIVRRMLAEDPFQRPTAQEVAQFCKDYGNPADPVPIERPSSVRAPLRKRRSSRPLTDMENQDPSSEPMRKQNSARRQDVGKSDEEGSPVQASPNVPLQAASVELSYCSDAHMRRNFPSYTCGVASSQSDMGSPSDLSDMDPHDVSLELSFDA
mmetsp:Transcript_19794/g.55003  ORF Transcript_19794/g.55003 Transcript_19794/m.55003 type:complete len:873 (-) Transcript_19794:392-3010(-)|eukprot:CAMPEP_0117662394 /NCGR_PEP_ID=MMETSP0804-20121206/8031_1 /TAXON_ID=1074897 /ORGANISM="Tetraselmis astigmatica, Strain CCMP880" /LENGTH=872 /DNA_ID=CAMNT_0005469293 /DNA_START=346 /DNA_END=2964 /DNA_ORIENTATION=-